MKNKMKLFGIGAAVLMTLLALTPATYGQIVRVQSNICVAVTQVNNNDGGDLLEQILEILETYEEEWGLLCEYMEAYYLEHGETPEEFPPELQVMWDMIINEILTLIEGWDGNEVILSESVENELLSTYRGSSPMGGGITDIEGPFPYFNFLPPEFGFAWRVWLDHDFVDDLTVAGAIIAFLSGFGPIGLIIALAAVGHIAAMKLTDQGNGVTFLACIIQFSFSGPGFKMRQLQPQ